MTPIVWTYLSYLILSLSLTVWVAKTLHKNGRIFLVDAFLGNEPLADSINHLLVVGFLSDQRRLRESRSQGGQMPVDLQGVLETLSRKVGVVLLVLGGMHFFNLLVFSKMRKRALLHRAPPPLPPQTQIPVAAG